MKKIVFCALAAFAAHFAFGGYAWYSEEINAILAKMPEKYYTKVNATLYGFFYGEIWSPPYAVYDSTTGKFYITDGSSFNVTSYATLNKYGKYDTGKSLDSFFYNCGQYVQDEFGNKYTMFDDNMASFYAEYEASNMAAAREAFNSLEAAFTMWKQDVISQTTDIGADVSKIAELTKEIDESLEKAKGEIQNAVDDTKATADRMNKELAKVQEDLTKISEEAVYNAQKQIDNAVSDFNGFVTSLENAISKGEWDDTMFEGAFNELTKSEQDLVDAITQLQQSSQDTEAQNAITILGGQLTGIRSLKSSLRAAIDAKDMNAALGVLNAAREMSSLYNSRAAVSKVNNSIKSLKSKASVLGVLAKAALSTMSEQDDFEASIGKLREAFSAMFITSMDNFHQINAYLGSTNSMAYVIKRESANDLSDFTIDELERWVKISAPDNIDDRYGFGASQLGGRRWNFIYDNLASTYTMWAWPLIDLDGDTVSSKYKFMKHFNLSGLVNNYKGFDEEYSELEGNPETNWVARGITAPKNWADGETVIVTNGKFSTIFPVADEKSHDMKSTIRQYSIEEKKATGDNGKDFKYLQLYGFDSTSQSGSIPWQHKYGNERAIRWAVPNGNESSKTPKILKYDGSDVSWSGEECSASLNTMLSDPNDGENRSRHKFLANYNDNTFHWVPIDGIIGGGGSEVDDASITTNTEHGAVTDGKASLYGFRTADAGDVPYKKSDGTIEWKPVAAGGALLIQGNYDSTVGTCTNKLIFASESDSNVKFKVTQGEDGNVTVKVGVYWVQ